MKPLQRTPSKITNTYFKFHKLLHEIETLVTQFTRFPIDTPGLGLLAQYILNKFDFFSNFFNAETISQNSTPDDLSEIQRRFLEQQAEFYRSNLHPVSAHEEDDSDDGSVCESCLNNDLDESAGDEIPEMMYDYEYEVMEPASPEELRDCDSTVLPSYAEKVEEAVSLREKCGKRRRKWWWRTVVILMPASVVVLAVSYIQRKQREGFLTPT